MISGVSFDGKHCQNDLGMLLASKEIGLPTVQSSFVDVPGRDGPLDLTESLDGKVHYGSRPITLKFISCENVSKQEWPAFISSVADVIHGRKVKIIFDDEPDRYYMGRCEMGTVQNSKGKISFTVNCTCEPYKYDESGNEYM